MHVRSSARAQESGYRWIVLSAVLRKVILTLFFTTWDVIMHVLTHIHACKHAQHLTISSTHHPQMCVHCVAAGVVTLGGGALLGRRGGPGAGGSSGALGGGTPGGLPGVGDVGGAPTLTSAPPVGLDIDMPPLLKKVLVEDYEAVVEGGRLVPVPRDPCVADVLGRYVGEVGVEGRACADIEPGYGCVDPCTASLLQPPVSHSGGGRGRRRSLHNSMFRPVPVFSQARQLAGGGRSVDAEEEVGVAATRFGDVMLCSINTDDAGWYGFWLEGRCICPCLATPNRRRTHPTSAHRCAPVAATLPHLFLPTSPPRLQVAHGLQSYFDKALAACLLYRSEHDQAHQVLCDGALPSAVYGAEHLARLLVRLPDLLPLGTLGDDQLATMATMLQVKVLRVLDAGKPRGDGEARIWEGQG